MECESNFVREIEQLNASVKNVSQNAATARGEVGSFKLILEQYLEQPQLLDPHLESLITPLTVVLAEASKKLNDADYFPAVMQTCRLLQCLISTRGYKTILRFFPNKAPDIELALSLLQKVETYATGIGEVDEDMQDGSWQTRSVLLLWLSGLVLIPFNFKSLQVHTLSHNLASDGPVTNSVEWIVNLTKKYLSDPGPSR